MTRSVVAVICPIWLPVPWHSSCTGPPTVRLRPVVDDRVRVLPRPFDGEQRFLLACPPGAVRGVPRPVAPGPKPLAPQPRRGVHPHRRRRERPQRRRPRSAPLQDDDRRAGRLVPLGEPVGGPVVAPP